MKRFCLIMLLLLSVCAAALAQPRYPAGDDEAVVVDAACVLSVSTARDVEKLSGRLEDEADVRLVVVTVDFLDGEKLDDYAQGLRDEWFLDQDEDLLLLMAVGEDQCGLYPGEDVGLSRATLQKLVTTHFQSAFLAQRYDDAIAELMPALVDEINKRHGTDVSAAGLFGVTAQTQANSSQNVWSSRYERAQSESTPSPDDRVTYRGDDSGYSLGKVVLIVLLLMTIFGRRRHRRRHH